MKYTIIITPQFHLVDHESKVAAKVAEKKILDLTSQVTERDEVIRQLKKEPSEVLDVTAQVTERDEEIRQLKEELHKRTKGNYNKH